MLCRWFYSEWACVLLHFTAVCNGGSDQNCNDRVVKTLKSLAYWGLGIKISRIFSESRNVYFILSWWKFYFQTKYIRNTEIHTEFFLFSDQIHLSIWEFFSKLKTSALDSQGCCEVAATDLEAGVWCFTKWALWSSFVKLSCRKLRHLLVLNPSITSLPGTVTSRQTADSSAQRVVQYFIQRRTGMTNSAPGLALWCMLQCIWWAQLFLICRLCPPAYSYLWAFSPLPCSPASPPPLHVMEYSLPSAICHHSPSLFPPDFFTSLACNKVSLTCSHFASTQTSCSDCKKNTYQESCLENASSFA